MVEWVTRAHGAEWLMFAGWKVCQPYVADESSPLAQLRSTLIVITRPVSYAGQCQDKVCMYPHLEGAEALHILSLCLNARSTEENGTKVVGGIHCKINACCNHMKQ